MESTIDYLPLGSIVQLNGSVRKYVVIARGLQVNIGKENCFFDYGGCMYPEGVCGDQMLYFQHKDIKKIVFEGYSDADDRLMADNIRETFEKLSLSHANVRSLKEKLEAENHGRA